MFSVSQQGTSGNWRIEGLSNPYVDEAFRIMRNRVADSKPICLFDSDEETEEYAELIIPPSASIIFVRRKADPSEPWNDEDPDALANMVERMEEHANKTGMIVLPGLLPQLLNQDDV